MPDEMDDKILELSKIPGVGVRFAKRLYDAGYKSPEDLKYATEEDLMKIPGMTQERAKTILSGVKEVEKEEVEDEEIERTIMEMKKEIAEIEESVERGEDIKFKVVKARAELAPAILSEEEEEESTKGKGPAETPAEGEIAKEAEREAIKKEKKKPKIIEEPQQIYPKRKKRPVIRGEEKKPGLGRRLKVILAFSLSILFIFSTLFVFYMVFSGNKEAIEIDGNFSDWQNKLFYKSSTDIPLKDVEIKRASVLSTENTLYFYVEVSGLLFMGKAEGVDALLIFVDADSDSSTGYLVGGGGADYKIEFIGWDGQVVRASIMKYSSTLSQNDWNAWSQCGSPIFKFEKGQLEGKVKIQSMNPRCFFYAKHTDNFTEYASSSETYVLAQKPLLQVNARLSGERVLRKGEFNPVIEMEFTAKGDYVALRSITLPNNFGEIKLTFPSGSEAYLPWILTENQKQTLVVKLKPSEDMVPNTQLNINSVLIDSDSAVMVNINQGIFYIQQGPSHVEIDGAFQDWDNASNVQAFADSESEDLPDSINILQCKVIESQSAFFMEVKANLLSGTEIPIGRLMRSSDGGASSQPQSLYGKDWLRFYIDTKPSLNKLNTSGGIVNGFLVEIGGISNKITDKRIYSIVNGVRSEDSYEIGAAKNETALEFIAGFVLPSGCKYYFEAEAWEGKKDVVEVIQPITKFYHEENQGSFGANFWLIATGDDALYEVSVGDFDSDGNQEIVTVSKASVNELIIWKNIDGTFFRRYTYHHGVTLYACAVGDFDGNGKLDIAVGSAANPGNADGKREIFILNNTGGSFARIDVGDLDISVNSIAAYDVDHDGYLDIVAGLSSGGSNEVLWYKNDRSGLSFTPNNVANPDKNVWCVDAGRINQDTLGDIVYTTESNSSKEVCLMSYTGSVWKQVGIFGDGSAVRSARIADFNNDGINDIAFATDNKELHVLIAQGTNYAYDWFNYSLGSNGYSLATCDFDNDGFKDIIVGCQNGSIFAFENMRNGSFTKKYLGNAGTTYIWDIETFDYDLDGDMDILIASDNRNLYILNNTLIHRDFQVYSLSETQLSDSKGIVGLAVSDLDNDGDIDIITAHQDAYGVSASLFAWQNPGDSVSSPFGSSWDRFEIIGSFRRIYSVACGDIDNDGWDEIVFSGQYGSQNLLCVVKSNMAPWNEPWSYDWEERYDNATQVGVIKAIALADVNKDGTLDIVTGDTNGYLVVWKRGNDFIDNNGDWLDNTAIIQKNTIYALATADMDNDGWTDIICGYESGGEVKAGVVWKNNKTDQFSASGWVQYNFDGVDRNITSLVLADFDRDSFLDVGSAVNGSTGLKIWYNPRNLSIPWNAKVFATPDYGGITSIDAGDVDNNGWIDIVAGFSDGHVLSIEGNTSTYFYFNTNHSPLNCIKLVNIDCKSNFDFGDLDLAVGAQSSCYLYKNTGANVELRCARLGTSSIAANETRALMRVGICHKGNPGDNPIFLSKLSIRFLNATELRIMGTNEMNDLFENVSIWLDDGNLDFSPTSDTWVASESNFSSMISGFLKVTLPKNYSIALLPGETKNFFIVVKMKSSISLSYSGYSFNISVWPDDSFKASWNYLYDFSSAGIVVITETTQYYSDNYTVSLVPESGELFLLLLGVGFYAVHYRKLRRKAF